MYTLGSEQSCVNPTKPLTLAWLGGKEVCTPLCQRLGTRLHGNWWGVGGKAHQVEVHGM